MNTMDAPRAEKVETLKDILENMNGLNNEMDAQLQMIADALSRGKRLTNNDNAQDDPLTIMDSMRHERDKIAENLKLLISIREQLW